MASLAPARKVALKLLGRVRRRKARVRDLAREDTGMAGLQQVDRALAMRLVVGAVSAEAVLDELIDGYLKRPSALEPRVRDALRLAAFELCYMDTPSAVAVSQGVELVRSVAPRATGLANAVLRKLVEQDRPRVDAARQLVELGVSSDAHAQRVDIDELGASISSPALYEASGDKPFVSGFDGTADRELSCPQGISCTPGPQELSLASGIPAWLCGRLLCERGLQAACKVCGCQLEPALVFVAANGKRHTAAEMECMLASAGMDPRSVAGMTGCFALGNAAPLAASGLVDHADLAISDLSAQMVCRIAEPKVSGDLLEVGQGRATKSMLLATATGAVHPRSIVGIDTVPYKVRVAQRRMEAAGLSDVVSSLEFDACGLGDSGLPEPLDRSFDTVLVDAPCTGTGTLRRHPEICAALTPDDVRELAALQLRILVAASARVAVGGTLVYATCSVLRDEDEAVVEAFLATETGKCFAVEPVSDAPACRRNEDFAALVVPSQTEEGFLLTIPTLSGGDGHFAARLRRR